MSNDFISEIEYKEIRCLISKSHKKIIRTKCIYPGCDNKIKSNNHIIAENLVRHYEPNIDNILRVEKDKYEVLFPPLEGRNLFKRLSIKKEPSFRAFCNSCDNRCFKSVDGYRYVDGKAVPDKVLLQMHYRIICNGLICIEKELVLVEVLLEYFQKKQWSTQIQLYQKLALQMRTSIDKHIKEKGLCEGYLTGNQDAPQMERVFMHGCALNPLCFGRLGYYAYQFSEPTEIVFTDFFGNMPFVTFTSIVGENGDSHMVFTALPEHANQLEVVYTMLEQTDPMNKLSHIIYIFSDGCILKNEHLEMHREIISKQINYFIENSGLYHLD